MDNSPVLCSTAWRRSRSCLGTYSEPQSPFSWPCVSFQQVFVFTTSARAHGKKTRPRWGCAVVGDGAGVCATMRRPRQSTGTMSCPNVALARNPRKTSSRGGVGTRRHVLASLAAASILLTRCAVAFHVHTPPSRAAARRTRGGIPTSRATRLPDQVSTGTVIEDNQVDTSAVLDDLARGDLGWEGHEYGFDWYLEQARRGMTSSSGFSPLRMNFWRPTEAVEELRPWDMMYIILRNLGQMVGLPSVDNAPVAKIEKYTGSWLTFLQKVSNGRLEDLAGGPLFLMLEKYFLAEGEIG